MALEVDIKKSVKGFALEIAFACDGGSLGILGASGCGKSMTLKCIAGVETPDEGRIVVNGRVLYDSARRINLPPQKRRVGYLFQDYALFPRMTVTENIGCGMPGKKGEKLAKIGEILARFSLSELGNRYPCQLSGGQKQRVALARMLASAPEAVLLDEPLSALDAHLKERLEIELAELLCAYGKDAILVTHSRDEVYRLCDRLLVMENGRSLEYGEAKVLFKSPKTLGAARLTGCKNLSAARTVGPTKVEALDWGVVFETRRPVPSGVTHVGVRAHDFFPASGGEENQIPILIQKQVEEAFEWNVLFMAAGAVGKAALWWKVSKSMLSEMPHRLAVACEDILLLSNEK